MNTSTMRVDIVSDVVCPWCVVGYRQLTTAAKKMDPALALTVHWHPFELNPSMGSDGQNLHEHISEKYGTTRQQNLKGRERLRKEGESVGIRFNYDDNSRMYNTFDAHQLLHWSREDADLQTRLKEALFNAYFTRQLDVSAREVLVDVAASVGLDRSQAAELLEQQTYAEAVRAEQRELLDNGVQGVPAIILDQRYSVPSAQSVDVFERILSRVLRKREAS